jgi:RNA polymerase sigma-B factor
MMDIQAMFEAYGRTKDRRLRQTLVLHYLPMVPRIARRYARRGAGLEDLTQIGSIGLIRAVTMFDPSRGVKFETYAFEFITGEIRHFLRDGSETVRPPRWLRTLYARFGATVDRLVQELGRTPSMTEIARAMDMTEEGVGEILEAHGRLQVCSIHQFGDEPNLHSDPSARQRYESFRLPIEDRIVLMQAMDRLATMQRRVVYCLFYQDLTQGEAAKRLGISQRHVSRLLAAALRRLAEPLRAAGLGPAVVS